MRPLTAALTALLAIARATRQARRRRTQHRAWDRTTPSLHLAQQRHYEKLNRIIHGGDDK